jgi:hypothetical protein
VNLNHRNGCMVTPLTPKGWAFLVRLALFDVGGDLETDVAEHLDEFRPVFGGESL